MIINTLLLAFISGVLYRWGGAVGMDTKFRDAGVPAVMVSWMLLNRLVTGWWIALALLVSFGLMWGALTTYRYFLPKPKDYQWYHYALHGFFVALAMFPYAYVTGHWIGFAIRVAVCAAGVSIWSAKISKDWLEEGGRGFIITASLPLLLI